MAKYEFDSKRGRRDPPPQLNCPAMVGKNQNEIAGPAC